MSKLNLQVNAKFIEANTTRQIGKATVIVTPPLDEEYWLFRVELSDKQAVVGFPKFSTIGIGFQREEDWNTNLPYTCKAEEVYQHIKHNKADTRISKAQCIEAIGLIQEQAAVWLREERGELRN